MRDPITGRFLSTADALNLHSIEIFEVTADTFRRAHRAQDGTWHEDRMVERLAESEPDPETAEEEISEHAAALAGWYWWTCVPGCLPDSEACGPFPSERKAASDALAGLE